MPVGGWHAEKVGMSQVGKLIRALPSVDRLVYRIETETKGCACGGEGRAEGVTR